MTPPALGVLQHLAANLKSMRLAAGLSQEALSQASGVSRRMLVGLEAGEANVSFVTLDHVARALGVSFAELIRPPAPQRGDEPTLAWRGQKDGSHALLLQAHHFGAHAVELWEWRLASGDRYDAQADQPGFHEMLYVVDGTLTLRQRRRRSVLEAGGSLLFATDHAYAYVNESEAPRRFMRNVLAIVAG